MTVAGGMPAATTVSGGKVGVDALLTVDAWLDSLPTATGLDGRDVLMTTELTRVLGLSTGVRGCDCVL